MNHKVLFKTFAIICIIIIILTILLSNNKKIKRKENANPYIRTAENVTINMLEPEFWINAQVNPEKSIMTKKEIQKWNEKYREKLKNEGNLYENALEKDIENVQYGFTVSRASMREMPTNEQVYESEEDKYFCELQVSSILMNEPVIVHYEDVTGQWYYVTCRYCSGWIEKVNVGLNDDWQQWKKNMEYEEFLLVTGNKEILDVSEEYPPSSQLVLYMGTRLELVKYKDAKLTEGDRIPYECYIVKVPVRNEEGKLEYSYGFVPVSRDVNVGYLSYSKENLIISMFKISGDRYGWGGMYNSRDCSQYVMEIYSLFGFEFPRNSSAQAEINFKNKDISKLNYEEKKEVLNDISIGSLLYFEGHIMLYLGEINGEYFVISQTARIMEGDSIINAHSCMITSLSTRRPSGKMWITELKRVIEIQ